jgi:hypothetical protein
MANLISAILNSIYLQSLLPRLAGQRNLQQ